MKRALFVGMVLAAVCHAPSLAQDPELPDWEMRDGESWAEECWTARRGGQMMGSGRPATRASCAASSSCASSVRKAASSFAYRPAVKADLVRFGRRRGSEVTFVNADHDYAQRVRYWREDGMLRAEISLRDGSNPTLFAFRGMNGQ